MSDDTSFTPPQQALRLLRRGELQMGPEWQKAHAICQTREGTFEYDLVHALAHWIEGDMANRDYWYRRVGVEGRAATIAEEADRIEKLLG